MSDIVANPTPAVSDISASTPAPATQEPSVAPSPTTQAPNVAPQSATPQVEPSWLKGRLDEARAAAVRQAQSQWQAQAQQREAALQAQYEAVQRQLHAVVGVTPQGDPETEAIKQQFQKLYPGLAQLEQRAKDLLGVVERSGEFDSQSRHYWNHYGHQMMNRLYTKASESLGQLSDEGKRAIHASFSGYIQSSPELVQRYMEDPSVVDEFWTYFQTNFIDPVRRNASATVQQTVTHRALPQDTPGGAPQLAPAPKPANLDERAAQAWSAYQSNRTTNR